MEEGCGGADEREGSERVWKDGGYECRGEGRDVEERNEIRMRLTSGGGKWGVTGAMGMNVQGKGG